MTERHQTLRRFSPALTAFAIALVACIEKKESPPTEEQTVVTSVTEPADGGAERSSDEEAEPAPADGGTKTAPAPCVSFAKRVLPAFDAAGCAAIQCHGTRLARGIRIEIDDPTLSYESLTTFAIDGKRYVKPGAGVPDDSSIRCHLAGKCGVKMPPLGGDVPSELVTAVDAWLGCGAPNN